MRNRSGATGSIADVTLKEYRRLNLRQLLIDLARPGLCLILGAGASHGVIPMSVEQIATLAREIIDARGDYFRLPGTYLDQLSHPGVRFLTDILQRTRRDNWDNTLAQFLSPGQATFVLGAVFTPRGEIPRALTRIYDVVENQNGVIVSYNYDRITDRQSRFPVIAPHGQRARLFGDPHAYAAAKRLAWELNLSPPSDLWLPVPETEKIRIRYEYQQAVLAWRRASAIVFIGYGFGSGADAFSFEDFAEYASRTARVHVLNPPPDKADLARQIGHACRARRKGFRVYGQPFRWKSFAEALLQFLDSHRATHVRAAIGYEAEVANRHDRN